MSTISNPMQTRTNAQSILRILACTALTAISARFAVHLPFTPVPVTGQVAAVLFSGLVLGARGAFSAQGLYLLAGLAGAPVFAFGAGGAYYLFSPSGTGGYLLTIRSPPGWSDTLPTATVLITPRGFFWPVWVDSASSMALAASGSASGCTSLRHRHWYRARAGFSPGMW